MILLLSAASLIGGVSLTQALGRFPTREMLIERCSGTLLVSGLLLIGGALPLFR